MKILKRIIIVVLLAPLFGMLIIAFCNLTIIEYSKGKIYDNVKDIPYKEVGLLLGTSPTTINGWTNIYYTYRIDAAVKLYKAKKISRILISGDGKEKSYDEPKYMRRDLIKRGIPAHKITLDKKGLRTYDSVINAKETFGLSNFTVISQRFQNERAIYLAGHNDIDAIGFNAKDAPNQKGKSAVKVRIREVFAKVKVFMDLILPACLNIP
ncbi:MAG: YdcF family protein [Bacteroidaceae bacterium]|nr:YdcF family protein [Bacteroidaceae bacterium]